MRRAAAILILGALALPSAALAQGMAITPGAMVKAADVQAMIDAAIANLASKDDVNAVAATVPTPATTAPPMEQVGGAAGSAPTFRRGDAVQPRISRTLRCTTTAAGICTLGWLDVGDATPVMIGEPEVGATDTQVPTCDPVSGTVNATSGTIKCFVTQSILGLGLAPYKVAVAGVVVHVLVLPRS